MAIESVDNMALAAAIAKHLGLAWHDGHEIADADLIDAAYEALRILNRRGRLHYASKPTLAA